MADIKKTIIDFPGARTMCVREEKFPEGIQDAFRKLESKIGSMRGRKCYGTLMCGKTEMVYRACVEPLVEGEAEQLQLEKYTIPPGRYAAAKLNNWQQNIPKIKEIFVALDKTFDIDASRPQIEIYRSNKEAFLLHPVIDENEIPLTRI